MSKLSRYCEGLIEAAWLAAVLCVPVYVNTLSVLSYEPDKTVLVRCLALFMLAVWLIKVVDQGGITWDKLRSDPSELRSLCKQPLFLPAAALVIVYLLSTILSVTPLLAFDGSYYRLQGAYSLLSYVVIFALIAINLRRRAQLERLLTAIILSGGFVGLYGILQKAQFDPLVYSRNEFGSARITSSMGNPIFMAAFLIITLPLTLVRFYQALVALVKKSEQRPGNAVRVVLYFTLALAQLLSIFFSGSRGPVLGLIAGGALFFLLLALLWRKRLLSLCAALFAGILAAVILILNLPGAPLHDILATTKLAEMGRIFAPGNFTTRIRTLYWDIAAGVFLPHEPLQYPDGSPDALNLIRPLIGYGQDTAYVVSQRFYNPELTSIQRTYVPEQSIYIPPDRFHNGTWDWINAGGILGLVANLGFLLALFYYGFRWLGFIQTTGQRYLYWGLSIITGLAAAGLLSIWQGRGFFAPGLAFGISAGVLAFAVLAAFFKRPAQQPSLDNAPLLAGLMSVFMAHFVETNFGMGVAASLTYFWVCAALLFLAGRVLPLYAAGDDYFETDQPAPRTTTRSGQRSKKHPTSDAGNFAPWLQNGAIAGLALVVQFSTIAYTFFRGLEITNVSSVLSNSIGKSPWILLALFFLWAAGAFLFVIESSAEIRKGWDNAYEAALGFSATLILVFWLWYAANLVRYDHSISSEAADFEPFIQGVFSLFGQYYIWLLLISLAWGIFLAAKFPARRAALAGIAWVVPPLLLGAMLFVNITSNLNIIKANMAFGAGDTTANASLYQTADVAFRRTVELAPRQDQYTLYLSRNLAALASQAENPQQSEALMKEAEQIANEGFKLVPLNPRHLSRLALLYMQWISLRSDEAARQEMIQLTDKTFARATDMAPFNGEIWERWAECDINYRANPTDALKKLEQASQVDPLYDLPYIRSGDIYAGQAEGLTAGDPAVTATLEQAIHFYEQAFKLPGGPKNTSLALKLSRAYASLGLYNQAIQTCDAALPFATDNAWQLDFEAAQSYLALGDAASAAGRAQTALQNAPAEQQAEVQNWLAELP